MATLSYEKFVEGYAERSGMTLDDFHRLLFAKPCDCGDHVCSGWQVGHQYTPAADRIEALEAALLEVQDWILYELPAGTTRATANLIVVQKALARRAVAPSRDEYRCANCGRHCGGGVSLIGGGDIEPGEFFCSNECHDQHTSSGVHTKAATATAPRQRPLSAGMVSTRCRMAPSGTAEPAK